MKHLFKSLLVAMAAVAGSFSCLAQEENPPTEQSILQSGSWQSEVMKDSVAYDKTHKILVAQRFEYKFFESGRFAVFTSRDDANMVYGNINLYGSWQLEGNKLKFSFDPDQVFCIFKDEFLDPEVDYEKFLKSYIEKVVNGFDVIESISETRLVLKNPRSGRRLTFRHSKDL